MKVLQFAYDTYDEFGGNDYLPHNYDRNCVVYTGTHDNATVAGWFEELGEEYKMLVRNYLADQETPDEDIHWSMIALALRSVADTCIIPVQDYLGYDNSARINVPGTAEGNWKWRLEPGALTDELSEKVLAMAKRYGRANRDALENWKAEEAEEPEETEE